MQIREEIRSKLVIDNSENNNMSENIDEPDESLNEQLHENLVYKPYLKALYQCGDKDNK